MLSRRAVLIGGAAAALSGAGLVTARFRRAMAGARARIAPGLSLVAETRHGAIEYAESGNGPPVLFLHGTGGGFDQGLHMGARLPGLGYRMIAPSRFGYLRSSFPADAGPWAQAEALADLLDHLRLERVAVAGGSAGAIPAIALALKHPERVSALIPIVPAVYAPGRDLPEPWDPWQRWVAEAALNSDFVFWAAIRVASETMIGAVLATDPALLDAAAPEEVRRVHEILENILPISARAQGLLNDAAATGRPAEFAYEEVTVPTLAISLEDDRFGTAENARHIAERVPGAQLIVYPHGGHVWVGHDAEMFGAVDAFLREVGLN